MSLAACSLLLLSLLLIDSLSAVYPAALCCCIFCCRLSGLSSCSSCCHSCSAHSLYISVLRQNKVSLAQVWCILLFFMTTDTCNPSTAGNLLSSGAFNFSLPRALTCPFDVYSPAACILSPFCVSLVLFALFCCSHLL
jgi:hypothetical protein